MRRTNGSINNEEEYMSRHEPRGQDSGGGSKLVPFMLGAVVGGVIGAAIALLYAPAEGSDLRQGVKNTLEDLTNGAKDIIRSAKSSAEKLIREVVDPEDEDEEPSLIERAKGRAKDIIEDADRAIAEARKRASDPGRYDEDED
jgi:gas vesicle protein